MKIKQLNKQAKSGGGGLIFLIVILALGYYFFIYQDGAHNPFNKCSRDSATTSLSEYYISNLNLSLNESELNQTKYLLNIAFKETLIDMEDMCTQANGTFFYGKNIEVESYSMFEESLDAFEDENYKGCKLYCKINNETVYAIDALDYLKTLQTEECNKKINAIVNEAKDSTALVNECKSFSCSLYYYDSDTCIQKLAITKGVYFCQYLSLMSDKSRCFAAYAVRDENPSLCDYIPSVGNNDLLTANNRDFYREGCYYLYVIGYTFDGGTGNNVVTEDSCEGTYGKHGPIGLDDCASILCKKTGGTWTQAGLNCSCQSNKVFNQINGCN